MLWRLPSYYSVRTLPSQFRTEAKHKSKAPRCVPAVSQKHSTQTFWQEETTQGKHKIEGPAFAHNTWCERILNILPSSGHFQTPLHIFNVNFHNTDSAYLSAARMLSLYYLSIAQPNRKTMGHLIFWKRKCRDEAPKCLQGLMWEFWQLSVLAFCPTLSFRPILSFCPIPFFCPTFLFHPFGLSFDFQLTLQDLTKYTKPQNF